MSIDVGSKRVGIAIMQQQSGFADFKSILPREANKALNGIISLLQEKKIKTLVAGLPLGARQQRTPQCQDVEKFCRRIERRYPVKVQYVDEYLSSIEAEEQSSGLKARIDDDAAEIILKRFIAREGLSIK